MLVPQLQSRALFPSLKARAYLAHAAVSPTPSVVQEAVTTTLQRYAEQGLGAALSAIAERHQVRALAAQLLGASSEEEVGFVQSTTSGVIAIARSIPFEAGERIVLFEGEFPANVTPFQLVARDRNLECVMLPLAPFARSHQEGLLLLERELARGVRLVAVSAVQFQTGLRMPLKEMAALCHAYGAELFVDAIQALGAVPIDVERMGIDYLAAGGHKFLLSLEGAGLLYIRKQRLASLSLGLAGWTGHEEAFRFLSEGAGHLRYDRPLVRNASFIEAGALSVLSISGLGAALELLLQLGVDDIFAHVTRYLDALEPELVALGCTSVRAHDEAARSATLSVLLPEQSPPLAQVGRSMGEAGVVVSTPDGHLRFAPHFANALDEIPLVVSALQGALRG